MSACQKCGHDPDAIIIASWSFFVAREVQSLNAHRVNAGARWQQATYRRDRDAWQQWMRLGRMNQRIPAASSKRRVRLVRVYIGRQRAFDVDNLIGGLKPVVDALVREGMIRGDRIEDVEIEYLQRKGGPNECGGLWVFVEELGLRSDPPSAMGSK